MKILLKIISVLFLIPGFIFDVSLGLAFILSDGRADNHNGDCIFEWAVGMAGLLPEILNIPFILSAFVSAIPAGAFCIAIFMGLLIGVCYVTNGIIGSIIQLPFTGKIRWITLTDLTD